MEAKEVREVREEFRNLVKECGFPSLRKFAKECGVDASNIESNLCGRYSISCQRVLVFAKTLKVPVDRVMEIFYKEDMAELKEILSH